MTIWLVSDVESARLGFLAHIFLLGITQRKHRPSNLLCVENG